jgi:hypothetical protein
MPKIKARRPQASSQKRPTSARRPRKAEQRGAAMVEALIVISLLILGFMGVAFFREFYVKTLVASRLARGSVLVYSMSGCETSNEPAQWVGRPDLANLTAARPDTVERPASDPKKTEGSTTTTGKSREVMDRIPGLSGDGKGVMNPMATSDLNGRIRARTSEGLLAPERTIFDAEVRARSFVSCGDPVRNGEFKDVLKYISGIFL